MPEAALAPKGKKPGWLKVKLPRGNNYQDTASIISRHRLNTVCQDALCPNLSECWSKKAATFMILGNTCTRSCGFCAIDTGRPTELDLDEPKRVAQAAKEMGLRYVVVTSVNRDELEDGGASIFAETIRRLHEEISGCLVEVLIPDFQGSETALQIVVDQKPEILDHNTETVPRLYSTVRPQAKYDRTLELLDKAKRWGMVTKTGLMLGLGETREEVLNVMRDLAEIKLDILTLGQYLQPTQKHLPVKRFVSPEEFVELKKTGEQLGIPHVESAPLVRSSYHAGDVHEDLRRVKMRKK